MELKIEVTPHKLVITANVGEDGFHPGHAEERDIMQIGALAQALGFSGAWYARQGHEFGEVTWYWGR